MVEEGGFEPPKLTQQIYSLPPLATRELLRMKLWSWWTDSNPRPADYKSAALPTELHQRVAVRPTARIILAEKPLFVNREISALLEPIYARRGRRLPESKKTPLAAVRGVGAEGEI